MKLDRVMTAKKDLGEHNDCAVLALACVLHVSYETAWEALYRAGRVARDGTPPAVIKKAIALLGFKIRRIWQPSDIALATLPAGSKLRPTTCHPLGFEDGWEHMPDLLLLVPQHIAAYVDGVVEDWTGKKVVPIEEAWEIVKASDTVQLGERLPPVIYLRNRA